MQCVEYHGVKKGLWKIHSTADRVRGHYAVIYAGHRVSCVLMGAAGRQCSLMIW